MEIIVKKYEHYNRSLGKYIGSKREYFTELDRGGYVTQEEGDRLAQIAREKSHKPYKPSEKLISLLQSAQNSKDKRGNIRYSDRLVDGMKEVGVQTNFQDKLPKHYQEQGGFSASD